MLNGLLEEPINIPEYLLDGEGNDEVRSIRFFTHVDWESILEEKEIESITIPEGYILDGQNYNLTLPEGVMLYGVQGENDEENIENLYINEEKYKFMVKTESELEPSPEPESEPEVSEE